MIAIGFDSAKMQMVEFPQIFLIYSKIASLISVSFHSNITEDEASLDTRSEHE